MREYAESESGRSSRMAPSAREDRSSPLTRRKFLALVASLLPAGVWEGCARRKRPRVIVLGIDGMDPHLLRKFMAQGRLPHCRKLLERGDFRPLTTSDPPQSPVAWANFISGQNPGGHGLFDFIHRDPETLAPYLSTARIQPPQKRVRVGGYALPLGRGEVQLMRQGPCFWTLLEEQGIPCTVFRIPANFPPTASRSRTLSGMGTPDLLGTYGTFSYYVSGPWGQDDVSGGQVFRVAVRDHRVEAKLVGPVNPFRQDQPHAEVPFTLYRDPQGPTAKIILQDTELILREGEWSDWVTVRFEMLPRAVHTSGLCRFYLQQVHPDVALYVSPLNINPADPALPLSTPPEYAQQLVRDVGYFYTQGMPEDTKARSAGVWTDAEYLQQAMFVLQEQLKFYEYELHRFQEGLLFFYFSSLDLNSHIFWRALDPGHPLYSPQLAAEFGPVLPWLYGQMDRAIGQALQDADDRTLLMVMSDHGFTSFRRGFNLNTWLLHNGYAKLKDPWSRAGAEYFANTDWGATRAYGLGLNSLYLNQQGREPQGIVPAGEPARSLAEEIRQRLLAVRDPQTGEPVIAHVYRPEEIYSGPCLASAPDLIIGYNRNYRASWETILGEYPPEEIVDNTDPWSGDHCMDRSLLPGVLLCNRKVQSEQPALYDLAPTLLHTFGLPTPKEMVGSPVV